MMKIILIICFFALSFSLSNAAKCEKDWIYNEDNCYWTSYNLLGKNQPIVANWFGAQLYCQELGGNLAHFSTNFEMNLISMLAACSPTWIGLVYKHTPDTKGWVWWNTCNEAVINKSEPVCGSHQPVTARLDPKGIIVAEFPDVKLPFVCKREADPEDSECEKTTTTEGPTAVSDTMLISEPVTSSGEVTTEDSSGDASGAIDEHGSGVTAAMVTSKDSDTTKPSEANLRWSTDISRPKPSGAIEASTISTEAANTTNETATTIKEGTTTTIVTVITNKKEPTTSIKPSCNRTCSTGFIDDDSTCCPIILHNTKAKRFFDERTSKCYYLPIEAQAPVDYFAAQLLCQQQNMHLISIHSIEENHIVGFLSMCRNTWIGLENVKPSDVCNCRGWAWEDYTSQKNNNTLCDDYQHNFFKKNISPMAPVCVQSAQCGYIYPQTVDKRNQYYWKNCNCYELLNFICVE